MDFELSDEQIAFAQAAKDFAVGELAPHAAYWDQECVFPRETFSRAGELGFCGIYASEEIGGLALPRLDASLVFEEMAAFDPSTTAFLTIHNMATWMLGHWGSETVKEKWGASLSSGKMLASYCLTEPNAGSDAASLTTQATEVDGQYVLNGAKAFINGGSGGSSQVGICVADAPGGFGGGGGGGGGSTSTGLGAAACGTADHNSASTDRLLSCFH